MHGNNAPSWELQTADAYEDNHSKSTLLNKTKKEEEEAEEEEDKINDDGGDGDDGGGIGNRHQSKVNCYTWHFVMAKIHVIILRSLCESIIIFHSMP